MFRHGCRLVAIGLLFSLSILSGAAAQVNDHQLMALLITAYPDFVVGQDAGSIVWKDRTKMPFDDGVATKTFEEMLSKPSLKDMFRQPYPLGAAFEIPKLNTDPGRVRNEAFFAKMYGDCRKGGAANLTSIQWLPKKWGKPIRVTTVNGVAQKLASVSAELDELPVKYDEFLFPPAGTVNCRTIAGTNRLSAHGAGTAIDISTKKAHYWRWAKAGPNGEHAWQNAIPLVIVEIFEKHGFIWGGKWYHFDTMHFEYRPELILQAKSPSGP